MGNLEKDFLLIVVLDIAVFLIVLFIGIITIDNWGLALLAASLILTPVNLILLQTIPGTFDKREKAKEDKSR